MAETIDTTGNAPAAAAPTNTGDTTTQTVEVYPSTPAAAAAPASTAATTSALDNAPSSPWIALALIGVGLVAVWILTKRKK